jgi:hypothetical protein
MNTGQMEHRAQVVELGEGVTQAVCTCGWRSDRYGLDKQVDTMDALQPARDAADHPSGTPRCLESYLCHRLRSRSARVHGPGAETNLVERAELCRPGRRSIVNRTDPAGFRRCLMRYIEEWIALRRAESLADPAGSSQAYGGGCTMAG